MKADGSFCNRIRKYYAMGGNAEASGNVTNGGEFNFWADPEAAYIFLQKVPRPVTLVTWELCYLYSTFSLVNAHCTFDAISWIFLEPNCFIYHNCLTGRICMPQKVIQIQNHRFSWDLHHSTPLGRGLICQNIFGLRTVHMGVTGTPIFRLTKQNENTLWRLRFV